MSSSCEVHRAEYSASGTHSSVAAQYDVPDCVQHTAHPADPVSPHSVELPEVSPLQRRSAAEPVLQHRYSPIWPDNGQYSQLDVYPDEHPEFGHGELPRMAGYAS